MRIRGHNEHDIHVDIDVDVDVVDDERTEMAGYGQQEE